MTGLLGGLMMHSGRLRDVTMGDVLESSQLSAETLGYFYKDVKSIVRELYKYIKDILVLVNNNKEKIYDDLVFQYLLRQLREEPTMLKILVISGEQAIWEENLSSIVLYVMKDWQRLSKEQQKYILSMFCGQFQSALKKWSESDFDRKYLEDCDKLLKAWLDADSKIAEELPMLFTS